MSTGPSFAQRIGRTALSLCLALAVFAGATQLGRPSVSPLAFELLRIEGRTTVEDRPSRSVERTSGGSWGATPEPFAEFRGRFMLDDLTAQRSLYLYSAQRVVQVMVNDRVLHVDVFGRSDSPLGDLAPLVLTLPEQLLRMGENEVALAVAGTPQSGNQEKRLAPVYLAKTDELLWPARLRRAWSVELPLLASVATALLALGLFLPAWSRRRGPVASWSVPALLACALVSALQLGVDAVLPAWARFGLFFAAEGVLLVSTGTSWVLGRTRSGVLEQGFLLVALAVFFFDAASLVAGLWVVSRWTWPLAGAVPAGGLFLCAGALLAVRGDLARRRERDSRERVQRAEMEERQRIAAEMHDGLGSELAGLLLESRAGTIDAADLTAQLERSLSDLRLVVDSMEMGQQPLDAALGAWRERLAPRCRAAGIELHWAIADVDVRQALPPAGVLHVYRILQEAFTNAVRHGAARRIRVSLLELETGRLEVTLADDGSGFDPQRVVERGLRHMRERAREIDADLDVQTGPAGTTVRLILPAEGRLGAPRRPLHRAN